MRARTLLGAALVALLATPTAATAGGWWNSIDVENEAVGTGETVTAETQIWFPDAAAAEQARAGGGYHAYLLPGAEGAQLLDVAYSQPYSEGWWRQPTERTWVAEVEFSGWDGNLAQATATFEVPRVPADEYALMFCTAGCREALADVVPRVGIRVFADPGTARMARDIAALPEQVVAESDRVLGTVERLRSRVVSVARDTSRTQRDISRLEQTLDAVLATPDTPPPPVEDEAPWTEHVGWFVAGLATAVAALSWRRRGRDTPGEPELPAVPDDAGELVTGPPVPVSSTRR